jgi:flagellar basal-body rod modification protein FlgD
MAALEDVQVQSSVGIDGNSYTTAISNDKLTNDDFLKLLLEEMKMQDPTEPMDSAKLMDSQLKMSTIQANVDMATAMTSLQTAFANSSLSTAANLIGRVVEDGQTNDDGLLKSYKVQTVENIDGELYVNVNEMIGYIDTVYDSENETFVLYDNNGELYDNEGNGLNMYLQMEDGRFVLDDNNNLVLLDTSGEKITDSDILAKYTYGGETIQYDDEVDRVLVSSIQKIW